MNFIPRIRSFEEFSATATSDTRFQVRAGVDLWLEFADIWCKTNPVYIGTAYQTTADIYPEDVYTIPYPVNLADLYFMNVTAGSNATVIVSGTPLTKERCKFYGLDPSIIK